MEVYYKDIKIVSNNANEVITVIKKLKNKNAKTKHTKVYKNKKSYAVWDDNEVDVMELYIGDGIDVKEIAKEKVLLDRHSSSAIKAKYYDMIKIK